MKPAGFIRKQYHYPGLTGQCVSASRAGSRAGLRRQQPDFQTLFIPALFIPALSQTMKTNRRRGGRPSREIHFDYKEPETLRRYLTEGGKILPRRRTRLSAKQQRALRREIERARHLALLPYPHQGM